MRLWSLHPRYLDAPGLVALWREALLARAVLRGRTVGYRSHPQLRRFRDVARPVASINAYLRVVHEEATRRGYRFDATRMKGPRAATRMVVSRGQVELEWRHLLAKLRRRSPERYRELVKLGFPRVHPSFRLRPGPVEPWERNRRYH